MTPKRRGSVSSTSRAAWPPTRSWNSTKSAPSRAASRSPVSVSAAGPVPVGRASAGEPADDLEPLGIDVEQDQLVDRQAVRAAREALDQLRRVRAPAADDRDLGAHPPSDPAAGVLTRLLITLSAIGGRASPQDRPPEQRRSRLGWPASGSSSAPSRCTTRSISTCVASLDPGDWRPGDRLPTERELADPLRLQPDHRPPRARRARPRGPHRADARPRHVRACIRGSTATSPADASFTEEMQPARPRPGDAARLGPARIGDRGGRRCPRPRARLAHALSRAPPTRPAASRSSSSRSTCRPSDSRACSRCDLEHGSLYELLSTRYDTQVVRAREALEPVLLRAREARLLDQRRGAPALLIEGIAFDADGVPVEFGRTFVRGDRSRYYVERSVDRPLGSTAIEATARVGGASG